VQLRQLKTFRLAARCGSLAEAALQLHYAPSTVTEQIRALETELGAMLFAREARGVTLTEEGRRLLPFAEQMVDLADQAQLAIHSPSTAATTVVVGGLETLCAYRLPTVVAGLSRRHPSLQLRIKSDSRARLEQALFEGQLDLAVLLGDPPDDPALQSRRVGHEPLALIASPEHHLSAKKVVETRDLTAERLVLTEQGCSFRALADAEFARAGRRPPLAAEFDCVAALKRCVIQQLGVTLLPEVAVAEELAADQLVALPWRALREPPAVLAVWRTGGHSDAITAVLEMLRSAWPEEAAMAADGGATRPDNRAPYARLADAS
jgi:DNA-binding transcriptional LysR family regulator